MVDEEDAQDVAAGQHQRPRDQRGASAPAAGDGGRGGRQQHHHQAAWDHGEAGLQHVEAEAEPRPLGQLEELGGRQHVAVHREADQHGRQVGQQHRLARRGAQVDHRRPGAQLPRHPDREEHDGGHGQDEGGLAGPAPVAALGHRQQEGHERQGQQDRADPVEGPGGPEGGLRDDERYGDQHGRRHRRGDPEQRVPARVRRDQAGQRQARGGPDAEGGGHQGDRPADPLAGQLVAHDRDADRDERRREALQGSSGDDHGERPPEGAEHRPQDLEHEADQHHPALAVHVGEPADDGGRDGAGQQGGRDEPGRVLGGRVQQGRELRQQRDHQGLLQRHDRAGQGEHGGDEGGVGASAVQRCPGGGGGGGHACLSCGEGAVLVG